MQILREQAVEHGWDGESDLRHQHGEGGGDAGGRGEGRGGDGAPAGRRRGEIGH